MNIKVAFSITSASILASWMVPVASGLVLRNGVVRSFSKHIETVLVGIKGPLSTNDAQILTDAWKSEFNALHDSKEISVNTVMIAHEEDYSSDSLARTFLRAPPPSNNFDEYWSTYSVFQLDLEGHCLGCVTRNGDALLGASQSHVVSSTIDPARLKREFETNLCDTLRSSTAVFQALSECIVNFRSTAEPNAGLNIPELATTNEMEQVVETVILGLAEELTETNAQLFEDIWMQTYNEMHHTGAEVQSISMIAQLVDEEGVTRAGTSSLELRPSFIIRSASTWLALKGICSHCPRDAKYFDDVSPSSKAVSFLNSEAQGEINQAIIHRQFERALCDNLRTSSNSAFETIEDCIIDFRPTTMPPAAERSQDMEVVLLGSPGLINVDDTEFMNECIKMTYNALHDSTDVAIEKVSLESQEYHDVSEILRVKVGNSMTFKYSTLQFYVSGHCSECQSDSNDAPFLPPLLFSEPTSDMESLVLHREFEKSLCNELRGGPFAYFHEIEGCIVSFGSAREILLDAATAIA